MASDPPSVMIVAGEASGDVYGAELAKALRLGLPEVSITGVGGRCMREAGVKLQYDSSRWSAIGIAEALKVVPRLLSALSKLKALIKAYPPNVLVLIDFGAFNVRLGKSLPKNIKVLYYLPPGSWRRDVGYSRIKGAVDRVVTQFPWSAEALRREGFAADFFGHPLLDVAKCNLPREKFCARSGLDPSRPVVGLLPGSRDQEIRYNLPVMLESAAELSASNPSLQFAVPLAPSVDRQAVRRELDKVGWLDILSPGEEAGWAAKTVTGGRLSRSLRGRTGPEVRVSLLSGMTHDVLARSRAAIIASGTATLEAAILGCPMAIVYRGSRLTALEYKLLGRHIKYIGLPNILLDRPLCPELTQADATPERISETISSLVADSPERESMLQGLAETRSLLGGPGATSRTAGVVLEMLGVKGKNTS